MTKTEFNSLPNHVVEKCYEISSYLEKRDKKVYAVDIMTWLVIIQIIIKLVGYFLEWKNLKQSELTLLQKASLWVTIRFSSLKGASYSEVVDAVFLKLDEETFNAIKKRKFV